MTEEYQSGKLPNGWVWTSLGVVADYTNGRAFKSSEWEDTGRPILRIQNLTRSTNETHYYSKPIEEKYLVKDGDLLISWSATLGAFIHRGREAVLNQHIFKVTPHIDKMFLFYLVSAHIQQLKDVVHGSGMQHITKDRFQSSPIPLPPLFEQRRVVSKIEELFSFLVAGVESLRKVKAQLKRYRQVVLKYAFEGKLTEAWRKTHKAPTDSSKPHLETNQQPNESSDLRALPAGWKWIRIQSIARITGGLTKNPQRAKYSLKMPYLRVANVYAGKLLLDEIKYIGVSGEEVDKLRLSKGDLLIVEGNGSVEQIGRVAIWEGQISPCVHQNHIIKIRLAEIVDSKYVLYWLLSPDGRAYIKRVASSTSGLYTLSISKVSALPIPYASQVERYQIVEAIEQNLSVLEHVEEYLPTLFLLADRLGQSILKRAFEGRLIPQNPNDEPADKLLERIEAGCINDRKSKIDEQVELSRYVE